MDSLGGRGEARPIVTSTKVEVQGVVPASSNPWPWLRRTAWSRSPRLDLALDPGLHRGDDQVSFAPRL